MGYLDGIVIEYIDWTCVFKFVRICLLFYILITLNLFVSF